MDFMIDAKTKFWTDYDRDSGLKKIADYVRRDIELVTDQYPCVYTGGKCDSLILYGIYGGSPIVKQLEEEKKLDCSAVCGPKSGKKFC